MGVSDGGGTSTAKDDLLSGNDVYDGYDRYDNLYDEQFDSQYDNANDDIPMDVLIPLLISLWGLMSLCLCIYTHKFIWRSPAVSKLCMYVVLCSLVMFFATIIAFKPAHENDGWSAKKNHESGTQGSQSNNGGSYDYHYGSGYSIFTTQLK
ncbi:hypothetical protein B0I72DRAFT_128028 [Yarrowia lipolytica]|uniref:Uncharacterized protein n=1 Tax=Yarrowia lipolytica TaxID=4952 RepID=A0A371BZ24_YARLL|nr:hypothetical protein BKA91DRAFT_126398 [Yarrowia lipolytica]KAE8171480.1 hypothetical protein BKA90DRAFT_129658 [Yarrowia lipolytica]KAJ8054414.1 hypothetical protein LXG23DRAFT_36513 [Yarrowia lipolytica]RDW23052.1 hypothetical protein B0I71DRAFT_143307 [Yarrowia lipolytica]RDW33548.1 hypothetical protein B0I72DRAFT_128028 [Yarrowia lipolytica]